MPMIIFVINAVTMLAIGSLNQRALQGLDSTHQELIRERFQRLLPVLHMLLRPRDIRERNRTWAKVSPVGKGATSWLSPIKAKIARSKITAYAEKQSENPEELWLLFRGYCQYGVIGLIEALPTNETPLVPAEIQELADFHRLAKHPRSDAGIFIRELLNRYALALGLHPLRPFVARYAWATDRRVDRWYIGEHATTDHVPKATRRLNLQLPYVHQCWWLMIAPLPIHCRLAQRHIVEVQPWLCWIIDTSSGVLMGFVCCPHPPTIQDALRCLRWSIWHFGAPWWKARGVPERLILPPIYATIPATIQQVQHYLHCDMRQAEAAVGNVFLGWPDTFVDWIAGLVQSGVTARPYLMITLADLTRRILDYLSDTAAPVMGAQTPSYLIERGVSLPWEAGIAAALLLPSAGLYTVYQGFVLLWGVPFDLTAISFLEGREVDVRYNPDDARAVYAIYDNVRVVKASAAAFEHRMTWLDLVDDPVILSR